MIDRNWDCINKDVLQHVKTMDLPKVFPIVVPSLLCFLRFLSFHHRFTICSPGLLRSRSVFHDLAQFSTIFPACSTIFPFPPFSYHFPTIFPHVLPCFWPWPPPQVALVSTGLAMTNAQAALATWGEGSEPGQNIDPDSTEYYNRHWVTIGEAIGFMRSTIVSYISLNYSIVLYINKYIYINIVLYCRL